MDWLERARREIPEKRRRAGWNLIPSRLRNATARREPRILRLGRSAMGPLTKASDPMSFITI